MYAILSVGADVPEAWDATGPDAGLQLKNTTYGDHEGTHVSAWNDSDGAEKVFRMHDHGTWEDGSNRANEFASDISEVSKSTLGFLSAADGQDLMLVRLPHTHNEYRISARV